MARIRSIHPGLFTDENFMALGDAARMFLIGLWTEADDQGVFEWKPLTLKARLRPVDEGSVEPLLEELVANNWIRKFSESDKAYGALRNFRKFQRPQKPNAIHPLPDEISTYVGLVRERSRTDTRKSPQMEDGGGKREEEEVTPVGADEPPNPEKFYFEYGKSVLGAKAGGLLNRAKTQIGEAKALALIRESAEKQSPREYFSAALLNRERWKPPEAEDEYLEGWRTGQSWN